jgi:hypothetical protein
MFSPAINYKIKQGEQAVYVGVHHPVSVTLGKAGVRSAVDDLTRICA